MAFLLVAFGWQSCEKKPERERTIWDVPCEEFIETAPPQHLVNCGERVTFRTYVPIDSLESLPENSQERYMYYRYTNPDYHLCGAADFSVTLVFRSKNMEIPFKPQDLYSSNRHYYVGGGSRVFANYCDDVLGFSPRQRYNPTATVKYLGVQPSPDSAAYYHIFSGASDCPAYELHCLKAEADSILLEHYLRFKTHAAGGLHEAAIAELKASVDSIFFINEVTLIGEAQ